MVKTKRKPRGVLKVYRWTGARRECPRAPNGSRQTRELCAAHSKAELARIVGVKSSHSPELWNLSETGNDGDIAIAMAEPGVVFWRPLDFRRERIYVRNGEKWKDET